VFFANPKTGSASVRAFLDPISDVGGRDFPDTTPDFPFYSHMRPIEARAAFDERGWPFDNYYRFTFVRDPWRRMISLYRMIRRLQPSFPTSFAQWLHQTRTDGVGGGGSDAARWRKYGTYSLSSYAGDGAGKLLVDDVFRLEDVADVPRRLRERGLPLLDSADIPHLGAGAPQPPLKQYYTRELIDLVARRYAEDIARFGYSYP